MLTRVLLHAFIRPVSLLPFWFLYGAGSVFLFIAYSIFGYRKDVVLTNLKNSFPEKSSEEIETIAGKFYQHFGQLFAEGLKGFTISRRSLLSRYKVINPEILDAFYAQNKSVILVSGHLNNWEFFVQSLNIQFKHKGVGVGQDVANDGFGYLINYARKRFGMTIWGVGEASKKFGEAIKQNEPFACMLLADQSPASHKKAFWMRFLNQDTPTIFGPEYYAKKYNLPVFYYEVIKVRRGFYEVTLKLVSDDPGKEPYGDITYKHNKLLEASIKKQPENWLWSHKRWKHGHYSAEFEVRQ